MEEFKDIDRTGLAREMTSLLEKKSLFEIIKGVIE
jgi:hypothetical protein